MDAAVALRRPHGHGAVEGPVRLRVAPISLRWSDAGGAVRGARLHHRGNFRQSLPRAGPSLSPRLPAPSRLGALCAVSLRLGDAAVSSAGTCRVEPDVLRAARLDESIRRDGEGSAHHRARERTVFPRAELHGCALALLRRAGLPWPRIRASEDRKSTRLNSIHLVI